MGLGTRLNLGSFPDWYLSVGAMLHVYCHLLSSFKPMNAMVDGKSEVAKFLLFSGHDTTCKLHTWLSIRLGPIHKRSMVAEKALSVFIQPSDSASCGPANRQWHLAQLCFHDANRTVQDGLKQWLLYSSCI